MTDRTTKALLLAIVVGLWTNLAAEWLRPVPVQAIGAEARQIPPRPVQFEDYSYRSLARDRTFRRAVGLVVENCSVDNGYVYGSTVSC